MFLDQIKLVDQRYSDLFMLNKTKPFRMWSSNSLYYLYYLTFGVIYINQLK